MREDLRRFDDKLDSVTKAVGEGTSAIVGLAAEFRAMKEQHTPQIGILFRKVDALDTRTGNIERDYTPRESHEELVKSLSRKADKQDLDKVTSHVAGLAGKMWFYMGAASIVAAIFGAIMTAAIVKVMG